MVTNRQPDAQRLIHRRAQLVHDEIQNARALYNAAGKTMPTLEGSPWMQLLERLYAEEFLLAKVLDESELIAHAEGPALNKESPRLDIVTWLCSGIQSQARALTASALNLGARSRAVQSLQFRLTGLAPGSLYAGFSIVDDFQLTQVMDVEFAGADGPAIPARVNVVTTARNAIENLTKVSAHATDDQVSESLGEEIEDPAQRDASLMAALKLAPTGRNGVSSILLRSSFEGKPPSEGILDVVNRLVIQDTLRNRPLISKSKKPGSFVGQLRALDLDKTRVDLRGIRGIGHLRCIVHLELAQAQKIIGEWVRVTGEYETNASGRPRLMMVQDIEVVPEPPLAEQMV